MIFKFILVHTVCTTVVPASRDLKAYRWEDDTVAVFRVDRHAQRMVSSAKTLHLPVPDEELFIKMVNEAVADAVTLVPPAPGSLYIRPVLIGTDQNIGAAATPSKTACFYVLTSPVGNYFADGEKALRLLVEDKTPRTTPQFGCVKNGCELRCGIGDYAGGEERTRHRPDFVLSRRRCARNGSVELSVDRQRYRLDEAFDREFLAWSDSGFRFDLGAKSGL